MGSLSIPPAAAPTVTFLGAAQTVTGSMHLLEAGGRRVLLDCGLYRGPREARDRNRHFPFDPAAIEAVVLSHSHIDHCGNLPNLVRQGFAGPIYCTPPTRDLLAVMLADSARIQEQDTWVHGVVSPPAAEGRTLYARPDVARTLELCVPVPYDRPQELSPDLAFRFLDAGHILGSALVALTVHHGGRELRLTFTGDLGRPGMPLLRLPAPVPAADLLICESTYGGRAHDPVAAIVDKLAGVVARTIARGGWVLVPAFSLGRTQSVVAALQAAVRSGRLPAVPVFVDSPLATEIAGVYRRHADCLRLVSTTGAEDGLLDGPLVHYLRSAEESRALDDRHEPCVVVAAGGMCDGGRILRHLKRHLDDPRCSVVLVSYQAPGTVGRKLLERGPTVRIHGRKWNKWADVVELSGFSGHADRNELLAALAPLAGRVGKVRLVHGEPEQAGALAAALRQHGFADVAVAEKGTTTALGN